MYLLLSLFLVVFLHNLCADLSSAPTEDITGVHYWHYCAKLGEICNVKTVVVHNQTEISTRSANWSSTGDAHEIKFGEIDQWDYKIFQNLDVINCTYATFGRVLVSTSLVIRPECRVKRLPG